MNVKKIILLLLVVMILALTIASTASASKFENDCAKAIIKFDKISHGLSHSKATNLNAVEAHNQLISKLLTEIAVACYE